MQRNYRAARLATIARSCTGTSRTFNRVASAARTLFSKTCVSEIYRLLHLSEFRHLWRASSLLPVLSMISTSTVLAFRVPTLSIQLERWWESMLVSPMMREHLQGPLSVAESVDELAQSVVRRLIVRGHGLGDTYRYDLSLSAVSLSLTISSQRARTLSERGISRACSSAT